MYVRLCIHCYSGISFSGSNRTKTKCTIASKFRRDNRADETTTNSILHTSAPVAAWASFKHRAFRSIPYIILLAFASTRVHRSIDLLYILCMWKTCYIIRLTYPLLASNFQHIHVYAAVVLSMRHTIYNDDRGYLNLAAACSTNETFSTGLVLVSY